MAESTKLRLVRCPKCENLLSEPEDSPFFQCGGCFTVLRSKIKDSVSDKSLEEEEDRTTTKPVSVNSCNSSPVKPIEDSSEEEASSDSDANVVVPVDVESDPANSILGGEKDDRKSQSGRIDSGLDRFKRRLSTTSSSLHDEAIEKDRASLLRQLDKLKEQLVQSCNVATPKQQQAPLNGSSSSNKGPPLRFYSSGNHIVPPPPRGPSYYHHDQASLEPQFLHHNMMYREQPSMFQMHGRGPGPRPYFSGQQQYVDSSVLDVYPQQNGHFHHSSCSCYHCYHDNKYWRGGVPVAADAPYNAGFYPPPESVTGFAPPPPPPHNPRSYGGGSRPLGRWHSNAHIRQLSSGYRHIRPLSGGAPFITCQNCFELLQLPKKQQTETTRGGGGGVKKLRCGACSCLMDLSIVDNKYIISTSREEEEEARNHRRVAADYTSDDYDLLGYVFHSLDDEQPRELQNVHSHSASLTEEEEEEEEDELSSGSVTAKPLAQVQDSPPLGENFGYCLINQDRSGVGSQSSRSEQEKVITLSKRQNSMKEVSLASEMEVSFNDYSHGGVSKDHHHHQQQQQRSKKSGFASIVKKSFKDLTKSIQNDEGIRSNVSVNGHFLTERSMKKAEKQAGVIQPGNYWYDYRAGFWGVMGGPCLGILPPFIEELNYPLPENCAGGTTGVFVNGRELHRKDLDLLAARGLPSERDRSYIVDITGKVIDEDTGEELDCLGKLAPTIEKLKRGFGMRLPKRVPI